MIEQGHTFNDLDVTGDLFSVGMKLDNVTRISFQSVFTGSPNGIIKLQISNDLVNLPIDVVNWQDYLGSDVTIASPGKHMLEMVLINVKWVRMVYLFSSGTGRLTTTFCSILDGRR